MIVAQHPSTGYDNFPVGQRPSRDDEEVIGQRPSRDDEEVVGQREDAMEEYEESLRINPFVPTCSSATAAEYLRTAAETIEERGKLRDQPSGERSMARTVAAYNSLFGYSPMDETKGWQFMVLLKFARMAGGQYHEDDYIDAISYAALAAESAKK